MRLANFKILTIFFLTISFVYISPCLITKSIYWIYGDRYRLNIEKSIKSISKEKEICIVSPVLNIVNGRNQRTFQIINSPSDIDLFHIIDHAIRQKLVFFSKEGRSVKERVKYGKEMHFGVLTVNNLYIWSFTKQKLIKLPFSPDRLVSELRSKYLAFSLAKENGSLPKNLNPNDYFCPLILEKNVEIHNNQAPISADN